MQQFGFKFFQSQEVLFSKQNGNIVYIEEDNKSSIGIQVVSTQYYFQSEFSQGTSKLLILKQWDFQSVQSPKQLQDISVLIKSFWVIAVYQFTKLGIYKCVYGVILSNFQIKCGCYSHKGTEYSSSQGSCIGLFLGNLQVSADTQSSLKLLKITVAVKLIFEDLFQQQDLFVTCLFVQYDLEYPLAFKVIIFFFHSLLKASS